MKVACYGLAFKPDIDDLRESPALNITKQLAELGFNIVAIEPNIQKLPTILVSNVKLIDLNEAKLADIHLILVDHSCFKLSIRLNSEYIVDTRGLIK